MESAAATLGAVLGVVGLLAYAFSSAFYIAFLYRPSVTIGRLASGLAMLGALVNLGALYARAAALHSVPYRDLMGSMTLFGFFLASLNVLLEMRHRDLSLGAFLMPAALVFNLLAVFKSGAARPPAPELKGSIFALHVTLNMLSYSAFAVACALSLLYLAVRRSLKNPLGRGLTGPASRLPTLGYLERANRTSLGVGVVALAVGLSFGLFWAFRVWREEHPLWALDPKVWMALLTLGFYVVVLLRAHRGAPPVTTARLSVIGFVLVLISYTAVNLLVSRLHVFT
jgi:ABC-type transport system involved in cytochrome c biogenesis permease subunit